MRILSVVRKYYYGDKTALEPMYLYFTVPLREMGHEVETFDHYEIMDGIGILPCTERLIERMQTGSFDLVLYQTSGKEPVETAELAHISKKLCIAAWNSDDDWQWNITRRITSHFTFMITTYPHIYEQNRNQYPNLLQSQWGCLELYGDHSKTKEIGFSFAGAVYGTRNSACRFLKRKVGLLCFGRGSRLVNLGLPYFRGAFRISWLSGGSIDFKEINDIWNRSRISYTPMGGGPVAISCQSRVGLLIWDFPVRSCCASIVRILNGTTNQKRNVLPLKPWRIALIKPNGTSPMKPSARVLPAITGNVL
jgi:hypothetical protein